MNIQITTWNVNSVRARSGQISQWLSHHRPDILCLQELKCQDEQFPFELFDEAGYNVILRGQKSYNGVAIASRYPVECISNALYPEIDDEQARFLDVLVSIDQKTVRVVNIYAPNGTHTPVRNFYTNANGTKNCCCMLKALLAKKDSLSCWEISTSYLTNWMFITQMIGEKMRFLCLKHDHSTTSS